MANKKLSELKEYRNLLREINFINEEELNSSQQAWLQRAKEILEKTADIKDATDDQVDATKDILKALNGIITGSGKHRDIQKHIDTILKSQNDSIKGIADNMDDINKKTRTLRDQWKQYMKEGTAGIKEETNAFSVMDGVVGGVGMKLMRMVKAPILAAAGGATMMVKAFGKLQQRLDTTGKNFGSLETYAMGTSKATTDVQIDMALIGKSLDDAQVMGKSLAGEMAMTAHEAERAGADILMISRELGVSESVTKDLFVNFKKISGMSEKEAKNQSEILGYVLKTNGFGGSFEAIMAEIGQSSSLLVGTSKDTLHNFVQTAINAKTLGLELKDIEAIRNKMLNVEDAMKSGMRARMLLGVKLNTQELTRLSLLDKDDELQRSIFNQLKNQNLSQIDTRYEVGLLADATGLSAEKMQTFLNAIKEGRTFSDLTAESMTKAGAVADKFDASDSFGGQSKLANSIEALTTAISGPEGMQDALLVVDGTFSSMAGSMEDMAKAADDLYKILIAIGGLAAFAMFRKKIPGFGKKAPKAPYGYKKDGVTPKKKPGRKKKVDVKPKPTSSKGNIGKNLPKNMNKLTKSTVGLDLALDAVPDIIQAEDKVAQVGQEIKERTFALSFATAAGIGGQMGPQALIPEELLTVPLAYAIGSIVDWAVGSGDDFIVRPGEKQIMKFNKDDLVIGGTNLGGAMGGGGSGIDYDQLANSMVRVMNENLHIKGEVTNRKNINAVLTTGAF